MVINISEKKAHYVRCFLAFGWVVLIFSMFYDPFSAQLTDHSFAFNPFHAHLPNECFQFVGKCQPMASYPLGARIFWGIIIPIAIFTLIIFGHETWRRACPLAFMSQIPRALGIQRRRQVVDPLTKEKRRELVTIAADSWLGKNVLYFQFGLLFLGLNIRLLLANSDRLMLGIFLILTILSAISIGYLYAGKTWCHYFCPMAPVQMVYTGPRSLLGSEAHHTQKNITQSMCRTVESGKKYSEKSACVSCKSSCFDIDAERSYWDGINQKGRRFLYYGYVGLVIGFYLYFSLYSGNMSYLTGGVWNETNQLATLFNPGFYIGDQVLPIPKLLAVPLTLGFFTALTYFVGIFLENLYLKHHRHLSKVQVRHRAYTVCTFLAFNFLFFLGVYPTLGWLTPVGQNLVSWIAVVSVSWWMYRTLFREQEQFNRESTASSLRRQLNKIGIDFSNLLEGRSLEQLKADEVYILAKTLPGLNHTRRLQIYKAALQESLEAGNVSSSASLGVFQDMRVSMEINEEEHQKILLELGVADLDLLNPEKLLSQENQLRLNSYHQAMEMLLLELVESGTPLQKALKLKQRQIVALRTEYNISAAEESQVLAAMLNENSTLVKASESLIEQLQILNARERTLQPLIALEHIDRKAIYLLTSGIQQKQQLVATQLLSILEILGDSPEAIKIANSLLGLMPHISVKDWQKRLSSEVFICLENQPLPQLSGYSPDLMIQQSPEIDEEVMILPTEEDIIMSHSNPIKVNMGGAIEVLNLLSQEEGTVKQAVSLYTLHQLDPNLAMAQAQKLIKSGDILDDFLKETAERIIDSTAKVSTLLLKIEFGDYCEEKIFQQPIVRIGRERDNDVVFFDQRISRYHAVIYLDTQGVRIQDLGGTNTIHIDRRRIKNQEIRLEQPSVLKFGGIEELSISVNWQKRVSKISNLVTLKMLLGLFESQIFQFFNLDTLLGLAKQGTVRKFASGEVIVKVGEPIIEVLTIVRGSINSFDQDQILKQTLKTGESIGELEVLTHQFYARSYTCAEKNTEVISVDVEAFEEIINQNPLVVRKLLKNISDRLQKLLAN